MTKEAGARIKINDLLKEAGWRFFDDKQAEANIILENQTNLTRHKAYLRVCGTVCEDYTQCHYGLTKHLFF